MYAFYFNNTFENAHNAQADVNATVKCYQKLAVAIDTSGSISIEHLNMFFSEIHGIWRQGAEVVVIESDSKVQRYYPYKGKLP